MERIWLRRLAAAAFPGASPATAQALPARQPDADYLLAAAARTA